MTEHSSLLPYSPEAPRTYTLLFPGADGHAISTLLEEKKGTTLLIVRDDRRMASLASTLQVFSPHIPLLLFPAWDCLPYDRVSPASHIIAERIKTLCTLLHHSTRKQCVITTVNSFIQRIPPREILQKSSLLLHVGEPYERDTLVHFFMQAGYMHSPTAHDTGEFSLRGSIIDVIPGGGHEGFRLDFTGNILESIRCFDPLTQISGKKVNHMMLLPASEVIQTPESIARFRSTYREWFGVAEHDPLYDAISEQRHYPGMEHWLPLFYPHLETLYDYTPGATLILDHLAEEAQNERMAVVKDHYQARAHTGKQRYTPGGTPYRPVPVESLYITDELHTLIPPSQCIHITPFESSALNKIDLGYRTVPDFFSEAKIKKQNAWELATAFLNEATSLGQQTYNTPPSIVLGALTEGSRDRLQKMLVEYHIGFQSIGSWHEIMSLKKHTIGILLIPVEHGFRREDLILISEQDILGERILRKKTPRKLSETFLLEAQSLKEGELVVHKEYGLGRFESLVTLTISGEKHDCLRILYAGSDKLYVPVENIDVLKRYGSENEKVILDKLGSASWQGRKAALKQRITLAAEELLRIAANRHLHQAMYLEPYQGMYEEFCARFPYSETEDQLKAIEDVSRDMRSGIPMDRLICGDVGYGKTEVALRAAFMATSGEANVQVAVVAPTTLLARQHYKTFTERFAGFPLEIRQLSRLVPTAEAARTRKALKEGSVDIVIGTHAVLARQVEFKKLGLLIVDEEQLFGVAQKERLKQMRSNLHVLSLSATPIPRTLQMSLSGIKELSLIATPPIDRLAIRSFVMPYDPVIIRDAILREHYRGGYTFYVAPRIKDLDKLKEQLTALVPEVKIVTAHGQMPPHMLDGIMNAFYDGKYDVLLSTNIVGSGLDVRSANTIIIHRADRFGLGQLYQLRGRVGRGKVRAYAYFTVPPEHMLSHTAIQRLEVMQHLDALGAGFSIASHDMDIRGFGNLLGEEQSGQIREVGVELYQEMLQEAVEKARAESTHGAVPYIEEQGWGPQINMGIPVLIPESYVTDLSLRMGLYRRAAELQDKEAIELFSMEIADRFGPLPQEVENLLSVVHIKQLCLATGIEKIDTGPKGIVLTFRNNRFMYPEALVTYLAKNPHTTKLRSDHKLVFTRNTHSAKERIQVAFQVLEAIKELTKQV